MAEQNDVRRAQRTAFGNQVDAASYDRYRPGYPARVVDWMLDHPRRRLRVLDLGAGTGKLTEALVERGHEVVAVDPSENMLAQLRERFGGVETMVGTAERVPLPDESVDAVIVAQAWHWFDAPAASAEIARLLKKHGWLGVLWNVRDESTGWVRELNEALGRPPAIADSATNRPVTPELSADFDDLERWEVENVHALPSADALAELAATWSYVTIADDPSLLERAREIGARHAHEDGTVVMPQNTVAFRARRR